ncbi:MAG: DUF1320 domain-containing protein [Aquisalimonadaceae bacterium]
MPYATQQNIIDRYGQDVLLLAADRDGDGQVDSEAVDQALADADAEIDTYLAAKYALPLAVVPDVLVRLAVDIALFRVEATADVISEERRQRYKDAVALLARMARGEVSLGLPDPPVSANGAVHISSEKRRFNRRSMRRLT